ncbi:conjugal transfer protein TraF [Vibrio sp. B172a]|uniref:conjugal transfer protein TraF n=1 Tax=Vibrio sp. B172a TaxID=2835790 RepID=UPI002556A8B2|nr:conjugal transfer protein TraF [Vibrio sp. B172a]MDK9783749.1 conjugal transfer protein TraF [Vibrio sp. B172a]
MTTLFRTLWLSVLLTLASTSLTHAQTTMTGQYAIVFFHFSQCPECHKFTTAMKQFERTVGLPVYDFSFDGQPIPGYTAPMPTTPDITNAFFGDIKNAITPATFLINVNTGKYVRLSEGNVSYQALIGSYQTIRADRTIMETMQ